MATAMLSLALGKPVKRKLGMTGELTLTGRVYPIGGVREKKSSRHGALASPQCSYQKPTNAMPLNSTRSC